jgi:hypothetical protein
MHNENEKECFDDDVVFVIGIVFVLVLNLHIGFRLYANYLKCVH